MESLTKELWYGNLIPQNDCRPQTEEYKQLSEFIIRHKHELACTLTDEQLEIFDKLDSCYAEYTSLGEEAIFAYAYKLGIRTAFEAFYEDFNLN